MVRATAIAGWHRVVAAGRPRVAARSRRTAQPAAAQAAVLGHRLERVRRAGRVVAADLAVQRADQRTGRPAAGRSAGTSSSAHRPRPCRGPGPLRDNGRGRRRVPRTTRPRPAGAPGPRARSSPGATSRRSRARWRSRRFTRLRTTALPTALLTTKPDPRADRPPRRPVAVTQVHDQGAARRCGVRARTAARKVVAVA